MRWWILSLFILMLPLASAATSWHWAGDTFKIGENVYSVEGTDYTRVLFSANGRSWVIGLGECIKDGLSEYCYVKSAYPSDDDYIKYVAGDRLYGYYMDIKAVEPKLTITRTQSIKSPQLGDRIEFNVKFENKGDYPITFLVYDEPIPTGLEITSGPRDGSRIRFETKSIGAGGTDAFSYTLRPTDYVNTQLQPNVSHKYEGGSFTAKVVPINLVVETPLEVNHTMPKTANLGDPFVYSLNITNEGEDPMDASITIILPEGLRSLDRGNFTADGATHSTKFTLKPEETRILSLKLYSTIAGSYKVPVTLDTVIRGASFKRYYDEPITIKADKLVPTIKLSSNRQSYSPGDKMTVTGVLENVNDGVTFTKINGVLSARGLFSDVSFNHEAFPPKKTISEAEAVFTFPEVENKTTFDIKLTGKYTTPAGSIYDFTATKTVTVSPVVQAVAITHGIEPAEPKAGTNVTVTVTGKNTYGKYATFTAFDTTDLDSVSGLMFAETSMERDETKTLYIYQLYIPEDYDKAVINITTQVRLKDEANPVRTTFAVPIQGRVQKGETQETATNETGMTGSGAVQTTKKGGFIASTWSFLKGLFS